MIASYFNVIRRWFWLIVLATGIAGTAAYWISLQEPTVYEAEAQLIIGPGVDSASPDLNSLRTGSQLMQTYAELVTTRPVLQAIVDRLKLDTTPAKLRADVEVKANQETQILAIQVQDTDEEQAVAVANALAEELVRLSPSNTNSSEAKLKEQMRNQATKIEASLPLAEARIKQLEIDFQATHDVEGRSRLMDQLTAERNRLSDAQHTLAQLYDSIQAASTNQVSIVESAIKGNRVDSQLRLKVLIGALAGLVFSLIITLSFEYFDDTIKTVEDLTQQVQLPLLGTIARYRVPRGTGRERLVVQARPTSRPTESYRVLGTKIFSKIIPARNTTPSRSILLSSTQPGSDMSEIAANLATVLTQTGQRVILVDAHLSYPTIGPLFDLATSRGLTNLLLGSESLELNPIDWAPGLFILPGGPAVPNPFELLASQRMARLVEELEGQADIVIIAAAPLLSSADSLILTSYVDGVIIVAHNGQTRRGVIDAIVENLNSLNTNTIGCILDYNHARPLPRRSKVMSALSRAVHGITRLHRPVRLPASSPRKAV